MPLNPTLYKFQITSCRKHSNKSPTKQFPWKTQSYEKTVHHNKITTIIYVPSGGGLTQRIFPKDKQQIQSKLKFINMKNLTWRTAIYFFNVEEGNDKQEKVSSLNFIYVLLENGIKNIKT